MPWTTGGILEGLAVVVTLIVSGGAIGRPIATAWRARRDRAQHREAQWARIVRYVEALVADMGVVKGELQSNGGSTVKDAVAELRADVALERAARRAAWGQAAYELRIRPDGSLSVLYVTPQWSILTGLSREESQRDGWARAVHHEDREEVMRSATEATEAGTVFVASYRLRNVRTQREFEVDHVGTPVLDAKHRVVGFVGVVTPIDEAGTALRVTSAMRHA